MFVRQGWAVVLLLLSGAGWAEALADSQGPEAVEDSISTELDEVLQLDPLTGPSDSNSHWGGEGAGLVRKEDWDTLSDWGQVVRILTLGGDAPNSLWMGALESYTLLSGHLVRR